MLLSVTVDYKVYCQWGDRAQGENRVTYTSSTQRLRECQDWPICDLSGPLWPIMAPRLGTGLAWSHLAIQKSIETKQRNFNVSQMLGTDLNVPRSGGTVPLKRRPMASDSSWCRRAWPSPALPRPCPGVGPRRSSLVARRTGSQGHCLLPRSRSQPHSYPSPPAQGHDVRNADNQH